MENDRTFEYDDDGNLVKHGTRRMDDEQMRMLVEIADRMGESIDTVEDYIYSKKDLRTRFIAKNWSDFAESTATRLEDQIYKDLMGK